jgi:DNA-binding CsgD family transcriptional regulator
MILLGHYIHFHALRLDQTSRIEEVLTERGRICLELVLNGHKPTLIGKLLALSVHTVRMHLCHAQERLHCHSLPEAVVRALDLGIISCGHGNRPFCRIL